MTDPTKVFELSKLLHERARLGIMSILSSRQKEMEFTELVRLLKLTKGNLSLHLRKLEEAGYITMKKEFVKRISRTTYLATPKGRGDFTEYLSLLEEVIAGAKSNGGDTEEK